MKELTAELVKVVTHCCDVKTFCFKLSEEVEYAAGQYLVLTLSVNGQDISKALSISSSPSEIGYVEVTKKITSSDFSKTLDSLPLGQRVRLRLPMGKFNLPVLPPDPHQNAKIAFLSGGIGITPIRSILKFATDRQLNVDIVLLYSSRTPEYLIFRDDFAQMQKTNNKLKIIYTLTDCQEKFSGCRQGHIDEQMVRDAIPDYLERTFYICGPPGMVEAMRSMLLNKLSLSTDRIVTEDFKGY